MIFHAHIISELSKDEQKLVVSFFKLPCIAWFIDEHIKILSDEFRNLDMDMPDETLVIEFKRIRLVQDFWNEFHLALKEITAIQENSNVVTEAEL